MLENLAKLLVEAFPFLKGFSDYARVVITAIPQFVGYLVDTASIVITAIPGGGLATSTFLILAVGAYYTLKKHGLLDDLFGGGGSWS